MDTPKERLLRFDSYEELELEIKSLADFRHFHNLSQETAAKVLRMSLSGYRKAEKRKKTVWRDLLAVRYITLCWQAMKQAQFEADAPHHLPDGSRYKG